MSDAERLFVSIAVSKPDGDLKELRGAITASERMANWADAHGYIPLLINDALYSEVTTDLLRDRISSAIQDVTDRAVLHRIIIFFAGHGAVLGIDDQTWMLSNWYKRPSEAVKLSSLQRMLEYYGPEQVTIIGDACQEYSKQFIDVLGHAILDRTDENPRNFELDRFFPVDAGSKAFMIKGKGGGEDFCLFTEVMLDALEGDAPPFYFEHIDGRDHITSQSLARYLEDNLPTEAGRYGVRMEPRPRPGYYTDRVYYTSPQPVGFVRSGVELPVPERKFEGDPAAAREEERRKEELEETRRLEEEVYSAAAREEVRDHFETGCGICITGARAGTVSPSRGTLSQDYLPPNWYRLELSDDHNPLLSADVLVELADESFATACVVQNFITSMHVFETGATNVLHEANAERRMRYAGEGRSDTIALLGRLQAGSLTEEEVVDAAAFMRWFKHDVITVGAVVAQFYDSLRDTESLQSVASFYAENEQPIPLDIVLFGGGRLFAEGDGLYADIPPTPKRRPRSMVERERRYTWAAMDGIYRHPIAGRVPWMRQAWGAIETADCDGSAEEWRQQALEVLPHLGAGQFSRVRREGRDALFALTGITDKREDPEPVFGYD